MRLMLYVRFYTNLHIRKRKEGIHLYFYHKSIFSFPTTLNSFLSIAAVENLMTGFLVGARGVL